MKKMNIPVGVSDFEEIRKNGYYYIDKSGLVRELLSRTGTKVTLITRPRRFGKTLGMSMLESFFDIRKDSRALFEGLEISENQALCDAWMNQYPTIFVSFRQVDGLTTCSHGLSQNYIKSITICWTVTVSAPVIRRSRNSWNGDRLP